MKTQNIPASILHFIPAAVTLKQLIFFTLEINTYRRQLKQRNYTPEILCANFVEN